MYENLIDTFTNPPDLYETTGIAFWDDEHISKSMLAAHLAADSDGASRSHTFIEKSVAWIKSLAAPGKGLLDLGCGPGLYAECLNDAGFGVTGIDFSRRSIEYAQASDRKTDRRIDYHHQDYLTLNYQAEFDVAILIYCDFGVLSPVDRELLLTKIFQALKPGGLFVLDVFTENQYKTFTDGITTSYEASGFWRAEPHLCLKRDQRYQDNNFLEQYTIITEGEEQVYNLWNHAFSQEELAGDLAQAGFRDLEFYSDVTGQVYDENSTTLCALAKKPL